MPAEYNDLTFMEPYLLAMAANEKGETGSQFFVTTDALQPLDGSPHTIIGRLVRGKSTLDVMEGVSPYRMFKEENASDKTTADLIIRDCGVYKFDATSKSRRATSAATEADFNPKDFLNSRNSR
jgi:cyclophilin family peptidyl-prolyl cis-trans isomerase